MLVTKRGAYATARTGVARVIADQLPIVTTFYREVSPLLCNCIWLALLTNPSLLNDGEYLLANNDNLVPAATLVVQPLVYQWLDRNGEPLELNDTSFDAVYRLAILCVLLAQLQEGEQCQFIDEDMPSRSFNQLLYEEALPELVRATATT